MNYHLLILVHGLWGSKSHFEYIHQQIEEARAALGGDETLVVYRTSDNEGYKTLDGIDVCGLRVASEIKQQINLLNGSAASTANTADEGGGAELLQHDEKGKVTKISIVGYSLGGLISRYAIGVLYHQGYFTEVVEPVNFTTFCTPHVGVLTPGTNISVKLFNWLVPNLLSSSGKQMFLKDKSGANREPLLTSMANPSSVFYKALKSFKYRNLYANAINDKRTSWWTAGISPIDPFMTIDETSSLDDIDFKFIQGYEPIVIDASARFIISNRQVVKDVGQEPTVPSPTPSNFWARKFKWVLVAYHLLIVAPIWVICFIVSGVLETFKSHRRINTTLKDYHSFFTSMTDWAESTEQLFECGDINEFNAHNIGDYDYNGDNIDDNDNDDAKSTTGSIKDFQVGELTIDQHLNDKTDTLLESIFDAITSRDALESAKIQQYDFKTVEHDNKSDTIDADGTLALKEGGNKDTAYTSENDTDAITELDSLIMSPSIKTSITELTIIDEKDPLTPEQNVLKVFTLDLSPEQLEIIKNLNVLDWVKFPVLIRHTKSTHSAAIVRNIDEKELYEGKVVVKHWLTEVLKLD